MSTIYTQDNLNLTMFLLERGQANSGEQVLTLVNRSMWFLLNESTLQIGELKKNNFYKVTDSVQHTPSLI